ncbi:MAG: hypothetical protein ACYC6C_05505 [Coriobacteriia bacterium]
MTAAYLLAIAVGCLFLLFGIAIQLSDRRVVAALDSYWRRNGREPDPSTERLLIRLCKSLCFVYGAWSLALGIWQIAA